MRYRGFRYEGDVLDIIYATAGEEFGVSEDAAIAAVAETLGVDAAEVTAFESETEPTPTRAVPAPPEPPAPPDPQAFKLAAYAYLGATAFTMPLAGYIAPALDALNARNWALARQIVGFAAQAGALTSEQYAHVLDLLAEHGIPEG